MVRYNNITDGELRTTSMSLSKIPISTTCFWMVAREWDKIRSQATKRVRTGLTVTVAKSRNDTARQRLIVSVKRGTVQDILNHF